MGEVTALVSVWYLPWHDMAVFCDCCRAGMAKEVAKTMILGKWGHAERREKGGVIWLFAVTSCMCKILCKTAYELRHTG